MSVALTSYSRQPRRMTSFALSTIAVFISGVYPEDQQEAVARTLTLESEPLVKLLEENAYRELIWRQRVNEAARAVMLACAAGNDLDVIGANYNTTRLIITPASELYPMSLTELITWREKALRRSGNTNE